MQPGLGQDSAHSVTAPAEAFDRGPRGVSVIRIPVDVSRTGLSARSRRPIRSRDVELTLLRRTAVTIHRTPPQGVPDASPQRTCLSATRSCSANTSAWSPPSSRRCVPIGTGCRAVRDSFPEVGTLQRQSYVTEPDAVRPCLPCRRRGTHRHTNRRERERVHDDTPSTGVAGRGVLTGCWASCPSHGQLLSADCPPR